jgi:3-phosphoshikimate 1-carboxyvinyltransferase
MAMAFAPAAIRFPELQIENPEVVSKSYPNFWSDLKKVGVKIE